MTIYQNSLTFYSPKSSGDAERDVDSRLSKNATNVAVIFETAYFNIDSTLEYITRKHQDNLVHLHLTNVRTGPILHLTWPLLQNLRLNNCRTVKNVVAKRCPLLREVEIENCFNLLEITDDVELHLNLDKLRIWKCRNLRRLQLTSLKRVRNVDIVDCSKLTKFPGSKFVNLNKIRIIRSAIKCLPSQCPKLTELVIKYCHRIKVLNITNYPKLQSLYLEGLDNIKEVSLKGASGFESLKLLNCKSLKVINLRGKINQMKEAILENLALQCINQDGLYLESLLVLKMRDCSCLKLDQIDVEGIKLKGNFEFSNVGCDVAEFSKRFLCNKKQEAHIISMGINNLDGGNHIKLIQLFRECLLIFRDILLGPLNIYSKDQVLFYLQDFLKKARSIMVYANIVSIFTAEFFETLESKTGRRLERKQKVGSFMGTEDLQPILQQLEDLLSPYGLSLQKLCETVPECFRSDFMIKLVKNHSETCPICKCFLQPGQWINREVYRGCGHQVCSGCFEDFESHKQCSVCGDHRHCGSQIINKVGLETYFTDVFCKLGLNGPTLDRLVTLVWDLTDSVRKCNRTNMFNTKPQLATR